MIESIVARKLPFTPAGEAIDRFDIEQATNFELAHQVVSVWSPDVQIVDRAGHARPLYRPMFLYHWLDQQGSGLVASIEACCEPLLEQARLFAQTEASVAASEGASSVVSAWGALVLIVAGIRSNRSDWTEVGGRVFQRIILSRRHDGSLLHPTSSDNPETQWYHELILTHALTLFAARTGNRMAMDVALGNAEFHQEQTQPDHATSQPWGLAAFVLNPDTAPLADQVLHAMQVQHPRGVEGVTLLLLHDALYCLTNAA